MPGCNSCTGFMEPMLAVGPSAPLRPVAPPSRGHFWRRRPTGQQQAAHSESLPPSPRAFSAKSAVRSEGSAQWPKVRPSPSQPPPTPRSAYPIAAQPSGVCASWPTSNLPWVERPGLPPVLPPGGAGPPPGSGMRHGNRECLPLETRTDGQASSATLLSLAWFEDQAHRPFTGPCFDIALRPGGDARPTSVREAVYLRERMGPSVGRSGLDREVAECDSDTAELASHRLDCLREERRVCRDGARAWQKDRERKRKLKAIQKRLRNNNSTEGPLDTSPADALVNPDGSLDKPSSNIASAQASANASPRVSHPIKTHGTPAPVDENALDAAANHRAVRRHSAYASSAFTDCADEMLDVNSGSRKLLPDGEAEVQSKICRTHLILRNTSLRPKQPKEARMQRIQSARKERSNRSAGRSGSVPAFRRGSRLPTEGSEGTSSGAVRSLDRRRSQMQTSAILFTNSVGDKDAIRQVFQLYDRNGSSSLDQSELQRCLSDMGIRGTNEAERAEVRKILCSTDLLEVDFREFELKVLPAVRERLAQLKHFNIMELFAEMDEDRSGLLSINEMVRAVRLLGNYPLTEDDLMHTVYEISPDVAGRVRAIEGGMLRDKGFVDSTLFGALAALLQERHIREQNTRFLVISKGLNLSEDEQVVWQDILVELHDAFHRSDVFENAEQNPAAAQTEVLRLLTDHGLAGMDPARAETVPKRVQELVAWCGSSLDFRAFLSLASKMRDHDRVQLEKVFMRFDLNTSGALSLLEVQHALKECRVVPRNQSEEEEIRAAVCDFDEDDSGEVDLQEFVRLCNFVHERLRSHRREEDRRFAIRCGYDERQFETFRGVFDALDANMNGVLEPAEVMQAAGMILKHATKHDVIQLFQEVGLDPNKKSTTVDMRQFLRMTRCFEQRDERRKVGAEMGVETQVLDRLSTLFRSLEPSEDGRVPRLKVREAAAATAAAVADGSAAVVADPAAAAGRLERAERELGVVNGPHLVSFGVFLRCMRAAEGTLP